MSDLFRLLPQAAPDQGPWVLVTLVKTEGSTYRKRGAHLLVNADGYLGMLSGGCLEADVAARCAPVLSGEVEAVEMVIDTRRLLGCDGRLTLIGERLPPSLVEQVARAGEAREQVTLHTRTPGPGWRPSYASLPDTSPETYRQELQLPLRLLVFGSGPGAPPLLSMAGVLGWHSEQIVLGSDPAVQRYPEADWTVLPNGKVLAQMTMDRRTAAVVMNHHVGRDTEVLRALWGSELPFLGLLGSRKRREQILEALSFAASDVDLDARHLYSPVGMDLAAEGAPEIALEICAQVQSEMAALARGESARAGNLRPGHLGLRQAG